MSVLYNRLKGVEKEKKADVPLVEGEEFPIDGEIKRQKDEQRRRTKLGVVSGIVVFLLVISVGVGVKYIKKGKLRKQLPKPVVEPSPSPSEPNPILPQEAFDQAEAQVDDLLESPLEAVDLSINLLERGTKLYKQSKYSEAATAYMRGLQQDPQQTVAYNNLGVVYYQQGKLQKALTQLKLAIELNPQYPEAHYNLAVVLEKLGQDKQALFHYLKFLRFVPPGQQGLQETVQAHVRYYY